MKCEECGLESTSEGFFRKIPRNFRATSKVVCPVCVANRDDAVYRFIFWTFAALTVAGLVLAVAVPRIILGPALLNLATLEASFFISTVLHELGHALAARLVGSRPFCIEIGTGRIAMEFLLWGIRWSVYFRGTRGRVLVELGRIQEGLPLLHQALKANLEKDGRALNACYLGIAAARRGDLAVSKSYFALARKLDRDCILLEREAVELKSSAIV